MTTAILGGIIAILVIVAIVVAIFFIKIPNYKDDKKIDLSQVRKDNIFNFMDFDEIKDNMIIRKNGEQSVMVLQCQGVNYDLMSEGEKVAIEEGFIQFLNALRYPVQLYIQTRSLNLTNTIDTYRAKVAEVQKEVEKLKEQMEDAKKARDKQEMERLQYEIKRKTNVLEYGLDITNYIGRMSLNRNVLQQKVYIVVAYYKSELGVSNLTREEEINMTFSELYTRCQTLAQALSSCEVDCRVLSSEELVELLYIAYNRDDAETISFADALDAQYDNIYATAKDVLKKKEKIIEEQIEQEAIDLASESILEADKNLKEKSRRVKERALELVDDYREDMDDEFYEETIEVIKNSDNPSKISKEMEIEEDIEQTEEKTTKSTKKSTKKSTTKKMLKKSN